MKQSLSRRNVSHRTLLKRACADNRKIANELTDMGYILLDKVINGEMSYKRATSHAQFFRNLLLNEKEDLIETASIDKYLKNYESHN